MGAWSAENFGNNDAADFVYRVEEERGKALIEAVIAAEAGRADGYIEAPVACELIAAGEFLALLNKRPAANLPEEVTSAAEGLMPDPELQGRILILLREILQEGELLELWNEAAEADVWRAHVSDLINRLA